MFHAGLGFSLQLSVGHFSCEALAPQGMYFSVVTNQCGLVPIRFDANLLLPFESRFLGCQVAQCGCKVRLIFIFDAAGSNPDRHLPRCCPAVCIIPPPSTEKGAKRALHCTCTNVLVRNPLAMMFAIVRIPVGILARTGDTSTAKNKTVAQRHSLGRIIAEDTPCDGHDRRGTPGRDCSS